VHSSFKSASKAVKWEKSLKGGGREQNLPHNYLPGMIRENRREGRKKGKSRRGGGRIEKKEEIRRRSDPAR